MPVVEQLHDLEADHLRRAVRGLRPVLDLQRQRLQTQGPFVLLRLLHDAHAGLVVAPALVSPHKAEAKLLALVSFYDLVKIRVPAIIGYRRLLVFEPINFRGM